MTNTRGDVKSSSIYIAIMAHTCIFEMYILMDGTSMLSYTVKIL